jgi:hypothetical protein
MITYPISKEETSKGIMYLVNIVESGSAFIDIDSMHTSYKEARERVQELKKGRS